MNFFTQPSLRSDTVAVADQQHPDHQLRINRGPTSMTIVGCKLRPQPREIKHRIDLAQQVIGGDALFKSKSVEKPTLRSRMLSHHRRLHRFAIRATSMESRFAAAANRKFFNKIGQKQTLQQ